MEKTLDRYGLAQVVIKDAINGDAEIYLDGHRVTGVIGYKIEQDAGANRVPLLTMKESSLQHPASPWICWMLPWRIRQH